MRTLKLWAVTFFVYLVTMEQAYNKNIHHCDNGEERLGPNGITICWPPSYFQERKIIEFKSLNKVVTLWSTQIITSIWCEYKLILKYYSNEIKYKLSYSCAYFIFRCMKYV